MSVKKRQTRTGISRAATPKTRRERISDAISDRWFSIPFPKWVPTAVGYAVACVLGLAALLVLVLAVRGLVVVAGWHWVPMLLAYAFVTGVLVRLSRDARRLATATLSRADAMIRRTRTLFVSKDED